MDVCCRDIPISATTIVWVVQVRKGERQVMYLDKNLAIARH